MPVPNRSRTAARSAWIDALRTIGSQLIVLHHLAFYGPMVDHVRPHAPVLVEWFADQARIAVQLFLVIAGFLAARSLSADPGSVRSGWPALLWRRYLRVVPPFAVALVLAVAASALARHWIVHDSIPDPPHAGQWLAHVVLLQDVLGQPSLTAGAWYVAIDFQSYLTLLLLIALLHRGRSGTARVVAAVCVLVTLSLFVFNRHPFWDAWAVYFFASYGLGALAWWAAAGLPQRLPPGRVVRHLPAWYPLMIGVAVAALLVDFRTRLAVAVCTSVLLCVLAATGALQAPSRNRLLAWSGRISYAVFLLNFPVLLVVNAAFERFAPHEAVWQGVGMLTGWLACIAAGAAFHATVEVPLERLLPGGAGQPRTQDAPGRPLRAADAANTVTRRAAQPR